MEGLDLAPLIGLPGLLTMPPDWFFYHLKSAWVPVGTSLGRAFRVWLANLLPASLVVPTGTHSQ